jgi:hypothetical protein
LVFRIHHHIRGPIQGRCAVEAAIGIVRSGGSRRAADPQFEIAVHVELEHEAVAATAVGGPGGRVTRNLVAVARDPDIVAVVNIDSVFDVGPDAALFLLAVTGQPARIGRTAPSAQQLAAGVEFQHPRCRAAAIRTKAINARLTQPIRFLPFGVSDAGQSLFKTGFVIRQGPRPVIGPDVVVSVHMGFSFPSQCETVFHTPSLVNPSPVRVTIKPTCLAGADVHSALPKARTHVRILALAVPSQRHRASVPV